MEFFFKDLLNTYRERLKSTFFSSFVLAWIGWNWKYFYITLFVSEEALNGYANKFTYMASIDTNKYILLVFPLLTTVLYILLLTPINWGVNSFVEFFKLQAKNTRINIWEKEKFSKDEVAKFRKMDKNEIKEKEIEIEELEKRFTKKDKEIGDLNEKIGSLQGEIDTLNNVSKAKMTNPIDKNKSKDPTKKIIDSDFNTDEEIAKFLKFSYFTKEPTLPNIYYYDKLVNDNKIFDFALLKRHTQVRDFFIKNQFVLLLEDGEYAKLTEKFLSFYKRYYKYLKTE
ncbi:MAG: hypothetical protein IMY72_02960 [Bacteroidetes bacterium]|nr:hypothetical protein [Bacteroidota bacterium]